MYIILGKGQVLDYIRKGPSTRQLEPDELNKLASIKKDYMYNKEYRTKLLELTNAIIRALASNLGVETDYLISLLSEEIGPLRRKFNVIVENCKVKNLSVSIFQTLIDFYEEVLTLKDGVVHRSLTFEEDQALTDLINEIRERVHLVDEHISTNKLINLKGRVLELYEVNDILDINLSLSDALKRILYALNAIHPNISMNKNMIGNLQSLLFSYDHTFKEFLHKIPAILELTYPPHDVQKIVKEELENFPLEFSRDLIPILKQLIRLKKAIESYLII
jgi:hypothetical protein